MPSNLLIYKRRESDHPGVPLFNHLVFHGSMVVVLLWFSSHLDSLAHEDFFFRFYAWCSGAAVLHDLRLTRRMEFLHYGPKVLLSNNLFLSKSLAELNSRSQFIQIPNFSCTLFITKGI